MTLLRTDQQVVLNDLLVAVSESVDQYQDAAEFLAESDLAPVLREIAEQRKQLRQHYETAIRASGDLPSMPDTDRESLENIAHRLGAVVAQDRDRKVIEQRLEAERQLAAAVLDAIKLNPDQATERLLQITQQNIHKTTSRLQDLHTDLS